MVYIYKKIIGKKPYYYLRASEKKGKKVMVKDIAYLGNSIKETKRKLNQLTQYKDKIRQAHRTIHRFLESNYYLEKIQQEKLRHDPYLKEKLAYVEACKFHYNNIFKKNDDLTKKEILRDFVIEFAYNTTSIEGNTITLKQAKNLLEEGKTPKNRTLREIFDLQNTQNVFFNLKGMPINQNTIKKIHSGLMENIDDRKGYRTRDVRVIKSTFKSTPAPYIRSDMNVLLEWYNKNRKQLHPLVLASVFHHKFEKIHPFFDGNGRTGRMLMNHILMKNDYPPIIIHRKFRDQYLEALREADKSDLSEVKNYEKLINFISDEMKDHYWEVFL